MTPIDFSNYKGREKEVAEAFKRLSVVNYLEVCIILQNEPNGLGIQELAHRIYVQRGLTDPRDYVSLIGYVSTGVNKLEKVGIVKTEYEKTRGRPKKLVKLNPEMPI